jgi:hypothetical protein
MRIENVSHDVYVAERDRNTDAGRRVVWPTATTAYYLTNLTFWKKLMSRLVLAKLFQNLTYGFGANENIVEVVHVDAKQI